MGGIMGGAGSFGLFGGVLNLLITIVVIVGIIWLVVWLLRRFSSNEQGFFTPINQISSKGSAREILQARYANGEITREQFQQILSDIS